MPTNYPKDRFDKLPHRVDRVGAHRPPPRKGRGWIAFGWALAATVLLVGIGVVGLFVLNNRLNIAIPGVSPATSAAASTAASAPASTPAAAPTPKATLDPKVHVRVLNGTPGLGVAAAVLKDLGSAGWTTAGAGNAASEKIPATLVYYSTPALEGAARGVVASLSGTIPSAAIQLSSEYISSSAEITVVVGNDYKRPGG